MGQEPRQAGQELEGGRDRTPEQVREEIEQTREELGDTVAALAQKTDVKAQAKRAADEARASAAGKVSEIKESVTAKREEFTSSAQQAAPESVSDAGARLSGLARRHRVALTVVVALGVGVWLGKGLRG
jgi:hypothetical protein